MKKITLIIYCLLLAKCLMAQRLSNSNGWGLNLTINEITEAGEDYPSTPYISAIDETVLRVRNISGTGTGTPVTIQYDINVNKDDVVWAPSLNVMVRRTSSGNLSGGTCPVCPSTIFGGLVYQSITDTQGFLFGSTSGGEWRRTGIQIQYQLSGMSVLLPVMDYRTRIVYTLDPTY